MGVDYYSKAAIGLKIPSNHFVVTETVKAFDHDYGPEINYCPKTGKACWAEESDLIEHPEGRPDLHIDGGVGYLEGIGPYDIYNSNNDNCCVVVLVGCESSSSRSGGYGELPFVKLPDDLDAKIEQFKKDMEACGLWNEENFGLYAVPYASY